jgi:teichuronic acid exporter
MSLKEKTIKGFTWSFIDIIAKQGLTFIIGIILARLLTPREFGLIGMTTIFISFSQAFIDSGFGQALVRKQNCTDKDYSTVFYFNLFVGIILFFVLFFSAGFISEFFEEPKLELLIKIIGLGLIIKSLSLIQSVLLIKKIDFKTQTKISVISSVLAGAIGIYMASTGFGVWSLVAKYLGGLAFTTVLLWFFAKWRPSLVFSIKSFDELFSFGSKLLASSIINRVYGNIYLLLIGKYFSASDLGYYTRANQFKTLFLHNLATVIIRVTYPSLSSIQDNSMALKMHYRTLIKITALILFLISFAIILVAKPMIIILIGEKWLSSALYLQLLTVAGLFHPITEINKNILKVKGKSRLILNLDLIIKFISIPFIVIGVYLGIIHLLISLIIVSMISYILFASYSGRQIDYSFIQQIKDIGFAFLIPLFAYTIAFWIGKFGLSLFLLFFTKIIFYVLVCVFLYEALNIEPYNKVKKLLAEKLFRR